MQVSQQQRWDNLDVLVIGAGFAGICAAIKLKDAGITNFRVVEKSTHLGGTWQANTYPGATCDVPSHFYSFSFAPNPDWSRLYSPQPEILTYIQDCATRFEVLRHIDFGQHVESLEFDETRGGWIARIAGRDPIFARFVVNGMGGLHRPLWPGIPGSAEFSGPAMHTAEWDADFDATGKRIAVIGSAASAIQVIPKLAEVAARVDVYQRSANYIAPRGDFAYSDRQKRMFARFPVWQRLYRWIIMKRMDLVLFPLVVNPARRTALTGRITQYLEKSVPDPELRAKLTPDYELGCKRILVSDDFYAAVARNNVEIITDGIERITPNGIVARNGTERGVDAIVYATGFDIQSQFTSIDIAGRGGVRLAEEWKDRVEAYRGVMVAGFPNYFCVTGPNSGVGTTSVVYMIENAMGWILRAMTRVPEGGTIDVEPSAQETFNRDLHDLLGKTVWAGSCSSWYKRADGRIETLYPGSARSYARDMRRLHQDELIISAAPV